MLRRSLTTWMVFLAASSPALPCTLCNPQSSPTLRQDAAQAKIVVFGTLANPRLKGGDDNLAGGTTDLQIEKVLKSDPFLGKKRIIELPRYVPVDAKNPPKFLIFCDVFKDKDKQDKIDPFRGIPVKSETVVAYLQEVLRLDGKDRSQALLFFFKHLDDADVYVANDAYMEFSKANDQEIGQVAGKLSASKLRTWLEDTQTPVNRIGLYGFLLGACGGDKDAVLLRSMLEKPSERTAFSIDGLLSGYIQLRPKEGWELAQTILRDSKKPFNDRYAVLRTFRFYHGWKPQESREQILHGLETALAQGDVADLAIEDLRRWKMWDLTDQVLAQYGKKSHDAPIVRRTIVRYALSCPKAAAGPFVAEIRKQDPELIKDLEEALQYEKKNP